MPRRRMATRPSTRAARWSLPGLVDLGVFAIDKPAFHFGGITRAALMPDQSPPPRSAEPRFLYRQERQARFLGPPARRRDTRALACRNRRTGPDARSGARGVATGADGSRIPAPCCDCCNMPPCSTGGGRACRGRRAGRQRCRHGRRSGHPPRLAQRPCRSRIHRAGARYRAGRNGRRADPFPSGDDPRRARDWCAGPRRAACR